MATAEQLITGVDFVAVPTRDLDAAVAFYGDTLGLQRSAYRPDAILRRVRDRQPDAQHHQSRRAWAWSTTWLATRSRCMSRTSRRRGHACKRRESTFLGDTFDTGVCHMAFFADPDGNALMLHHRYAPRTPEA